MFVYSLKYVQRIQGVAQDDEAVDSTIRALNRQLQEAQDLGREVSLRLKVMAEYNLHAQEILAAQSASRTRAAKARKPANGEK